MQVIDAKRATDGIFVFPQADPGGMSRLSIEQCDDRGPESRLRLGLAHRPLVEVRGDLYCLVRSDDWIDSGDRRQESTG